MLDAVGRGVNPSVLFGVVHAENSSLKGYPCIGEDSGPDKVQFSDSWRGGCGRVGSIRCCRWSDNILVKRIVKVVFHSGKGGSNSEIIVNISFISRNSSLFHNNNTIQIRFLTRN